MDEGLIIFWLIITCVILCFVLMKKQYEIETLTDEVRTLKVEKSNLYDIAEYYKNKSKENNPNLIPKGTIEAVKEAMKRSHPDNGGNPEDFRMYRRAYNVFMGKEKL